MPIAKRLTCNLAEMYVAEALSEKITDCRSALKTTSRSKMLLDAGIKLVTTANSAQSVISGLQNVDYDVILCNYDLGDGNKNGQELLERVA